ncbi:MAG: hypothetical protein WEE03_03710 [Chloroflexota bacterium]|nr:hypothetical protein [Candidatus Limnocylindria bacterium]
MLCGAVIGGNVGNTLGSQAGYAVEHTAAGRWSYVGLFVWRHVRGR